MTELCERVADLCGRDDLVHPPILSHLECSSQAHSEGDALYRFRMEQTLRETVWRNVSALMVKRWGRENLTRLGAESGTGPATPSRLKNYSQAVGLEVLQKLASALKVEPWELLQPAPFSPEASEIAKLFDAIEDESKDKAYAIIVQMLEFGTSPSRRPNLDRDPGLETRPGSLPASPEPRRIPGTSTAKVRGG